jgi:hypothetical protein
MRIRVKCAKCSTPKEVSKKAFRLNIKNNGVYLCSRCCKECELPEQKIKELIRDGAMPAEIIKQLGLNCCTVTIWRLSKRRGWDRGKNQQEKANEEIINKTDEILKLYESGETAVQISRLLSINYVNLCRFFRRRSLDIKGRLYNFNKRPDIREKRSQILKKKWNDDNYRSEMMRKAAESSRSVEGRLRSAEVGRAIWRDPETRKKLVEISRKRWYSLRLWEKLAKFTDTKPEKAVAFILDLYNETYKRNIFVGGGFNVDFLLPNLNYLIDVDGEYWHGRFKQDHKQIIYAIEKDKRKNDFIKANRSERYFRIWEQYTLSRQALCIIIGDILGKRISPIEYQFSDLIFRIVEPEIAADFILNFHYAGKVGPFVLAAGAFHKDILVGLCVFKYPTYNNNLGYLELSRFCIHPKYQIKNAASYMLSRFLKMVPNASKIITFADTTQGHDGTIYRAANFKEDGIVSPSYFYVDELGGRYHKKTIYYHASRMKMTEEEYALAADLKRVPEKEKIRFVYEF